MIMNAYAIRDLKADFNCPFFSVNDDVAVRQFASVVNDPTSLISQFPSDYQLFFVGQFNTVTGQFLNDDALEFHWLCDASALVKE